MIKSRKQLVIKLEKNPTPTAFDYKIYSFITAFLTSIGSFPQPLAKKIGNFLGDLGFWLDRRHRKIILKNLGLAFSDYNNTCERRKIAKAVYRNLGQVIFEVGWSLTASPEELNNRITIDGVNNLRVAYDKGKGVLVLTAHIGNWEILPIVADRLNITLNIVYRPFDYKPLNIFFEKLRARFGAMLVPSRGAMTSILRALKKGEAVAILMDQSADWHDGVWVDFFGHPACTSKGMALIALKTRCPVIPVFLYRNADGFRAVIGKEIPLILSVDKTKDVDMNTFHYTKVIENASRHNPEQWFWVHHRWKRKPYSLWPRSDA